MTGQAVETTPTRPVNPTTIAEVEELIGPKLPPGAEEFSTDYSLHSVPYNEILSGGPPKDGIPSIDEPKFIAVKEADEWLRPLEPVIQIKLGDIARAYPMQILVWHEIVNDWAGETPLLVTFCPLCNTAIVFERRVNGEAVTFGTTGKLRFSNLIMYDRQTESWWQQATGEAIAGELTGTRLERVPALIVAWQDFREAFPEGRVLSRDTGYPRYFERYGLNPYQGYDDINSSPFLFSGPPSPAAMPPMARVLTLDLNGEAVAFPYETLKVIGVANEDVGGRPFAIFWQPGVASALDAAIIAEGKDVGTAAAFSRFLDGQTLDFVFLGGLILDEQTGSTWDIFGKAVAGSLKGSQLEPVVSINHFWFSWAAFKPETRIYVPSPEGVNDF
ncbi:MAG: DUF3179 domain-containing protein [Anaerolineales bacterium]